MQNKHYIILLRFKNEEWQTSKRNGTKTVNFFFFDFALSNGVHIKYYYYNINNILFARLREYYVHVIIISYSSMMMMMI